MSKNIEVIDVDLTIQKARKVCQNIYELAQKDEDKDAMIFAMGIGIAFVSFVMASCPEADPVDLIIKTQNMLVAQSEQRLSAER